VSRPTDVPADVPAPDGGRPGARGIGEPASDRLVARLRRRVRTIRGIAVGLAGVLRLSWQVSAPLTVGLGVSTAVMGLVPAATTYLTRLLINAVAAAIRGQPAGGAVKGAAAAATQHGSIGPIVFLVVLQFVVFAVNSIGNATHGVVSRLLAEKVGLVVQRRIMAKASGLRLAFFEDSESYDLLREAQQEAVTRPANMVSNAFGQVQVLITFTSMISMLLSLNPLLALVGLVAPLPAFLADARYGRRMFDFARWSAPLRRRMQYLTTLVTSDTAAKEVQLFGLGPYLVARFENLSGVLYQRQFKLTMARNLRVSGWGLITTVVTSLTYLYVALEAIKGRLSVGDLVLFTSALAAVQGSVQALFRGVTSIYEDNLYLTRLHTLLAVPSGMPSPADPVPLPDPVRGHVVFEHVSFRYPGAATPALQDVSVDIPPGQTLAVVGHNGAGKSTLIKLLCRLYDPDEGRILLDGTDVRDLDPERLRSVIGGMFQDHVSYQATAADNIGLGNVGELDNREKIIDCARQGGAHELITGLPKGYETHLGKWFDHGVELSGGEWQKVALSRAFMRDARLLVLDEPTSALDAQAEYDLFERLRRLAHGRTTIYISHRFSTVRRADRVLLLDGGRVAEHGTHDELMAGNGIYAKLFMLQALTYLDAVDGAEESYVENRSG
jgi:ATP-binding cassette subfamily B protein